jgi:hypothetical protein
LALADIYCEYFCRAVLEEAICEPTGGSAKVERGEIGNVQLKMHQRVFQFVAAATHKFFYSIERDFVGWLYGVAGFLGGMTVDAHLAGNDEPLGALATIAQRAFDESLIETEHADKMTEIQNDSIRILTGFNSAQARLCSVAFHLGLLEVQVRLITGCLARILRLVNYFWSAIASASDGRTSVETRSDHNVYWRNAFETSL